MQWRWSGSVWCWTRFAWVSDGVGVRIFSGEGLVPSWFVGSAGCDAQDFRLSLEVSLTKVGDKAQVRTSTAHTKLIQLYTSSPMYFILSIAVFTNLRSNANVIGRRQPLSHANNIMFKLHAK